MISSKNKIIFALPKGRILKQLSIFFDELNIKFKESFYEEGCRDILIRSNYDFLSAIKVRSFDIVKFVATAGADFGIAGADVISEFSEDEVYVLQDLNIAKCKLVLACFSDVLSKPYSRNIVVASKYSNLAYSFFSSKFIQAQIIKLNGSIEIAPTLGMCNYVVDLVSSGQTLKSNNLYIKEHIMDVSSKLIVNKLSYQRNYKFYKSRL